MFKFNLNVQKESPRDKQMAMTVKKGDMFVAQKSNRIFVIALSPKGTKTYLVEVSNLEIVQEVNPVKRSVAVQQLMLDYGVGDYIAVEDIKDYEVALTLRLK